jgi:hypothetical protein
MDSEEEPHAAAAAGDAAGVRRSDHAAAAEYNDAEDDSYMDAGVGDDTDDDEDAAASEDPILGFGLSSSYNGPLPDPPARPSNASSLTALHADGVAAGSTAAAFLSPPPVARVPGSSSRWRESTGAMVTPRRPTAQQNLMNMLASPSFDRMAGMWCRCGLIFHAALLRSLLAHLSQLLGLHCPCMCAGACRCWESRLSVATGYINRLLLSSNTKSV